MVLRSSYLHNGISYTDKTTSLYWIIAQGPFQIIDNTSYCTISKPQDLYLELCDCLEIALKFDRHLGSSAVEVSVKFQSDAMI